MVEESSCALFGQGESVSSGEMTYCIVQRVREKKKSYERYGFEHSQEEAFATFFDLAQEYTAIESLYQICVSVAKEFFGLESRVYIIEPKGSLLELVCTSREGLVAPVERGSHRAVVVQEPTESEESWFFPSGQSGACGQASVPGAGPFSASSKSFPKTGSIGPKSFSWKNSPTG